MNDQWNRSSTTYMKSKKEKHEDKVLRIVEEYLAMAEDFPEVHADIIEGAKNMIAEDILMFEKQEEYEVCGRLKKAFEYLEQFK